MGPFVSRRELLLGAALLLAAPDVRAGMPLRIAAIDWAMLETLCALGLTPVAATELIQFRSGAVEPALPNDVVDLGLRGSPNFELLHLLRPDLILISPFYVRHEAALGRIAPLFSLSFYVRGEPPFEKALAAVKALGERLESSERAEALLKEIAGEIEGFRQTMAPFAGRSTYVVNIGDARHVRVFGFDSMFGDMLARLGLPNAWTDRSRFTFAAPVPIENLAADPDARIVIVSEVPVEARSGLRNSIIWNSLKPVRQGRVIQLANVNPYGGVTAGLRFARLFAEAMQAGDPRG
ncbi:iron-siderophore ABC transporter substrate-binding protein [Ensifer adhaerens]|uniref:iron-siderophore ABC transporter substrate-binding protein n=1 Tax=Ensifer adhaerens TaxID=106592 RepID=UPI003AF374F9